MRKLKVYRFHEDAIEWIQDYLSSRTEYVSLGGQDSAMRQTFTGVPQGSILGPTLFNVYVNEFPEIVRDPDSCKNQVHSTGEKLFGSNCSTCGNLTAFADNAVYITSHKDRKVNQERLTEILRRMTQFLNDNRMSVNPTKTILWEFMNSQEACKVKGTAPVLITYDDQGNLKEVHPSNSEKCLGATLQNNLTWNAMLESGEDALIPLLRKKLGMLKIPWEEYATEVKTITGERTPDRKTKLLTPSLRGRSQEISQETSMSVKQLGKIHNRSGKERKV